MYRALEQATEGGAPQPAESTADARRIASDGQAYTSEHYAEAYGDDAQRCWDDVKGDRSPPPRSPSPELEENRSPLPQTPSSEPVTHNEPSSSSTCPQFPPGDFEVTTRQSTFRKLRQNEEYSNPEKFKFVYWTETNKVMREMCESFFGRETSPERLLPLKRIVPVEKVEAEPELFEASNDMPANYGQRLSLPINDRYPYESFRDKYRRNRRSKKSRSAREALFQRLRQNEDDNKPTKFKLVYWTETNAVMREMCESVFGKDTSPERLLPLKKIVTVETIEAEPELFEASHDMPADYVLRTALPFKARYPHESATEVYRRQRLNNKTDMFRRLYLERCARKPPPQ